MAVIRAVGFDLGNTLVEYEGVPLSWQSLYRAALADAARALGRDINASEARAAEEVLARYNTRLHPREHEVSYRQIFGEVLSAWDMPLASIDAAADAFFAHFDRKARLFPDAIPVLTELNARGLRCGILTDLPYGMDPGVTAAQIAPVRHLVQSLVTSTGVGFRKPSPAGYLKLCSELGVSPGEAIYVGDETKDVEGALRAGLRPMLLDRSGLPDLGGASGTRSPVISSLADLLALIGLEQDR